MQINKFELIKKGLEGVIVSGVEQIQKENKLIINDGVKRNRKIPVSQDALDKVAELKWFYLTLIGRWKKSWTDLLNEDQTNIRTDENAVDSEEYEDAYNVWDTTVILSAEFEGGKFCITGEVEVVEGKPMKYKTPKITPNDNYDFYSDAFSKLDEVMGALTDVITSDTLMLTPDIARKYLEMRYSNNVDELERVENLNDDMSVEEAMNIVQSAGHIVLETEDRENTKAIGDGAPEVKENTSPDLGSERVAETEEVEEEEVPEQSEEDEDVPEDAKDTDPADDEWAEKEEDF